MSSIRQAAAVRAATTTERSRARAGTFVLGCRALAKVSAVEGISVSRTLDDGLRELSDADCDVRRNALAEKYGKF